MSADLKKVLVIVLLIVTASRLGYKMFKRYETKTLSSNEAVFKFYFDVDENDIDEYFNIPKGTYNRDLHEVIYQSAEESTGKSVPLGVESLNCNEKYDRRIHYTYNVSLKAREETPGKLFYISLVEKHNFERDVATRSYNSIQINNFRPGRINHVVLAIGDLKPGIFRMKHIVGYTIACSSEPNT